LCCGARGAAVPALLERAFDDLAASAAGPAPPGGIAQLMQQLERLGMAGLVHYPDLGQRLVHRDLAGDAAGPGALHAGGDAGAAQLVGPQRGQRQVRGSDQALHALR